MYRHTHGPTLIFRCTNSGAPPVLDTELDALCAQRPNVTVVRLPLTHLAPAWDAIDEVTAHIIPFLRARARAPDTRRSRARGSVGLR
jgi:hypothetical protein